MIKVHDEQNHLLYIFKSIVLWFQNYVELLFVEYNLQFEISSMDINTE